MNDNKIALITGATSGIGASFAKRFAQDGYDLIITGRRKERIQYLADELSKIYNVNVEVIIAELTDPKAIESLARYIQTRENIEILVNNAGFGIEKAFNIENIKNQEEMVKVHIICTNPTYACSYSSNDPLWKGHNNKCVIYRIFPADSQRCHLLRNEGILNQLF